MLSVRSTFPGQAMTMRCSSSQRVALVIAPIMLRYLHRSKKTARRRQKQIEEICNSRKFGVFFKSYRCINCLMLRFMGLSLFSGIVVACDYNNGQEQRIEIFTVQNLFRTVFEIVRRYKIDPEKMRTVWTSIFTSRCRVDDVKDSRVQHCCPYPHVYSLLENRAKKEA